MLTKTQVAKVKRSFQRRTSWVVLLAIFWTSGLWSAGVLAGCDEVKEGLVACYPFDGNADDGSGNGHNGVVQGNLNYTEGLFGESANFDGTNEILFPTVGNDYFSGDFSINFHLKPQMIGTFSVLAKRENCSRTASSPFLNQPVNNNNNNNSNFFDIRTRGGYIQFEAYTFNPVSISYAVGKILPSQWNFVTLIKKGSDSFVYINGLLANQKTVGSNLENSAVLGISNSPCIDIDATKMLKGELDELHLHNRALSEAEIHQLYGKETLTVTKTGYGNVTATGINCGTDCKEDYVRDSTVTLTAVPTAYATFKFNGWSGDCTGTDTVVNVTMDKAKNCVATFSATLTNPANGHAYQLINQGMTWGQGMNYCASQGGYLTTITSQNENSFVFNNLCAGKSFCWLGGRGYWYWITGERWVYQNWKPENGSGEGPVTGMLGVQFGEYGYPSTWNDFAYSDGGYPICEWDIPKVAFTVVKTGSGDITGPGINCGTDCAENFNKDSSITLTATPKEGYQLTTWGGDCTGNDTTVTVTLDKAKSCTALFETVFSPLTVTTTGNGTVTGENIDCGTDCAEDVSKGNPIILTAQPTADSIFRGWSGDCVGTSPVIAVFMDRAKTCAATFKAKSTEPPVTTPGHLSVQKMGVGSGDVVAILPAETLRCDASCDEARYQYSASAQIKLKATSSTDSQFMGWSGDCDSVFSTATVTVDRAKNCVATFILLPTGKDLVRCPYILNIEELN